MNNKLVNLIVGFLGIVVSFFVTREYFPNPTTISDIDTNIVVISEVYKQKDSLKVIINKQESIIDSLNSVITKKPKVIVKYVPKLFIVTKDSIVEVPIKIPVDRPVYDTIYIDTNNISIVEPDTLSRSYDVYVLSSKDKIILKLKKKQIKEGDILNIFNGENLEDLYSTYYNTDNIKRRMKFHTTSLYILATSTNKDIEKRMNKIIKNKNKL